MFKKDYKMLTQLDSEIELVELKSKMMYMKLPFLSEVWTYFCLTTEIQTFY